MRARTTLRLRFVALCAAAAAGCGGLGGPPPATPAGTAAAASLPPLTATAQELYRVKYEGPQGGGGLRLAVRLAADDRYRLEASDPFGRSLWTLGVDGDRSLLLDHRAAAACTGGEAFALPEIALEDLPNASLPRVLRGEAPVDPPAAVDDSEAARTGAPGDSPNPPVDPPAEEGRVEFPGADGVVWSVVREGGRVTAWTRSEGGRPVLWYGLAEEGSVLSHRDGSQFRWRRVAREEGLFELPALSVPAGYRPDACAALGVDSPGDGF